MQRMTIPTWMITLDDEEMIFIKQFVLHSGSLKEMAEMYEVSYPTVRLRLDRLIQKIEVNQNLEENNYVQLIKQLAMDEAIDFEIANQLIAEYRKQTEE